MSGANDYERRSARTRHRDEALNSSGLSPSNVPGASQKRCEVCGIRYACQECGAPVDRLGGQCGSPECAVLDPTNEPRDVRRKKVDDD